MTPAPAAAVLRNIGPRGAATRRRMALALVAVAAAALVALVLLDLPHRWRALLFIPLWAAALCWMQAAAGT